VDKAVRIFELIALDDEVVRFLLSELERACREKWDCLIEVDVSARAPRMQRTLIELGFLPVAYLPALVFHEVERLDVVKMVRLLSPPQVGTDGLTPSCAALAELVLRLFRNRAVLPRLAKVVHSLPLFAGLSAEQVARLAGACGLACFGPGEQIFREGAAGNQMHVVLAGDVEISVAAPPEMGAGTTAVGVVRSGECLGEMSLLTAAVHSATATAGTQVETAVLGYEDLVELIRRRPDIGLHIYRNVAVGMGAKLKRVDVSLAQPATCPRATADHSSDDLGTAR
jgi:hypothetical protein